MLISVANSQLLNEIMPMIYKRFTDKSAEEWRQIYKVRERGLASTRDRLD
jgi:hemerythrin superfamily protein